MCKVIIDGKTVEFEGSVVLTQFNLQPYQEMARHIIICDSVIEIRDNAFSNFKRLENIEISDSVKVIGKSSFVGCYALKAIVFPNSITELRSCVCMSCESLENVVIPDSVKSIGASAFMECRALKNVRIPNSVTHIGKRAFYWCISLQNVEIPASVTTIGEKAFWKCHLLKSIEIPESVTYIGDRAFFDCDTIRLKINGSEQILTLKALMGCNGQIISVDISGVEYSLLTCDSVEYTAMVITGYVDYARGKLYSGYEFGGVLKPSIEETIYCYVSMETEKITYYDITLSGLKRQLEENSIR